MRQQSQLINNHSSTTSAATRRHVQAALAVLHLPPHPLAAARAFVRADAPAASVMLSAAARPAAAAAGAQQQRRLLLLLPARQRSTSAPPHACSSALQPSTHPSSSRSRRSRASLRASAARSNGADASSDAAGGSDDDAGDGSGSSGDSFVPDIWQPTPPTPALGRKRKVALLVAAACLELSLTGGLLWAPLLGAVTLALLQPTRAEIAARQQAAVDQAVAAAELRASRQLPVTPVESAAWVNRLNQEMWTSFWQPFLLANNLGTWQDTIAAAAPRGWELEIADVSIGTLAPEMGGFQVFADTDTGSVTALDCDVSFNSSSVRLLVVGRGPLGSFSARVSAVELTGQLRITPLLQHRLLLLAFKEQPSVRVSISVSAPLFKASLPSELSFVQGLLGSAIRQQLVEPKRVAVSLDSEIRVEEAVATRLHLSVESISGLPRSVLAGGSGGSGGGGPRIALVAVDTTSGLRRATRAASPAALRRAVLVREGLSLELPRKEGIYRLEARSVEASGGSGGGGSAGAKAAVKGTLLGSCQLWVAAARDGTTLFWSHERSGAPLATRWAPSDAPWRVTLPLEPAVPGAKGLSVTLGVSVEPWVYKQPLAGLRGHRSEGPRVVVLQAVEARGLALPQGAATPSPFIQLCYDQECFSTSTCYGSAAPIYNELFAFQENASALTRRLKVEVWHEAASPAAAAAASSSSSNGRAGGGGVTAAGATPVGAGKGLPAGSGNSGSSSSGGGSGGLASYRLSDVADELPAPELASHLLLDVELEDEGTLRQRQQPRAASPGAPLGSAAAGATGSSSIGASGSSCVSLGSTFVNLDRLTENVIQDRWYALNGTEGGEVRLRLALVPGVLDSSTAHRRHSSSSSSSSSSGGGGGSGSGGDGSGVAAGAADEVAHMLAFFQRSLLGSSRDSLLVEVKSARLFLPLSSMDSLDTDQPAYLLSFRGSSTVTMPSDTARPPRRRPKQQGRAGGGGGKDKPRGSDGGSDSGGGGSGGSGGLSSVSSVWFEELLPGNVSQQVNGQHMLARALFPLPPPAAAASSSSNSSAGSSASGSVLSPGLLRVALFDAEEFADVAPAEPGSAGAGSSGNGSSSGAGSGASATAAAALGRSIGQAALAKAGGGGAAGGVAAVAAAAPEDIGSAALDVGRLLAAGRSGGGGISAGGAGAAWEGWVRLDKDGGHLLVRLTRLPAAEPADLVPPPSSNAMAGAGADRDARVPALPEAAAAAAALVAGAAGEARGSGSSEDDDGQASLAGQLKSLFVQGVHQAESQVSSAVSQLNASAASASSWWSSSNSSLSQWLAAAVPIWPGSSSSSKGSGSNSSGSEQGAGSNTPSAAGKPPAGQQAAAVSQAKQQPTQQQPSEQQQPQTQEQQRVSPLSSVDLSNIAQAWGWGDSSPQQSRPPSRQQQARAPSPPQQQQAGAAGNASGGRGGSSGAGSAAPASSSQGVASHPLRHADVQGSDDAPALRSGGDGSAAAAPAGSNRKGKQQRRQQQQQQQQQQSPSLQQRGNTVPPAQQLGNNGCSSSSPPADGSSGSSDDVPPASAPSHGAASAAKASGVLLSSHPLIVLPAAGSAGSPAASAWSSSDADEEASDAARPPLSPSSDAARPAQQRQQPPAQQVPPEQQQEF